MDRGRMWERRGGYERVEVRRGEVRKQTDVPLQYSSSPSTRVVGGGGAGHRPGMGSESVGDSLTTGKMG
jgi:hypothetical protein